MLVANGVQYKLVSITPPPSGVATTTGVATVGAPIENTLLPPAIVAAMGINRVVGANMV